MGAVGAREERAAGYQDRARGVEENGAGPSAMVVEENSVGFSIIEVGD